MEKQEVKELLQNVITQQMEAKAMLRMISFLLRTDKNSVSDYKINEVIDKISNLEKLEQELRKMM